MITQTMRLPGNVKRRCIIPAKKFYEWKKSGSKEKYEFYVPDTILYIAGIYHKSSGNSRFTILTGEAEECMKGIHSRMPVLLREGDMERWLFSKKEAELLLKSHLEELQTRKSTQEYEQLTLF